MAGELSMVRKRWSVCVCDEWSVGVCVGVCVGGGVRWITGFIVH